MATVREKILSFMANGHERLLTDICAAVDAPTDQVQVCAAKMAKRGELVRTRPGVYMRAQSGEQIPAFVPAGAVQAADQAEADDEDDEDDESKPPLQIAFWSDGDVVLRRGEDTVLVLDSADVGQLVAFLARTGHCYTHGELAARED